MNKLFPIVLALLCFSCNEGWQEGWTENQIKDFNDECANSSSTYWSENTLLCGCWINSFATSMSYENYNYFFEGADAIRMAENISPNIIVGWLSPIVNDIEIVVSKIEKECCNSSNVDCNDILFPLKNILKFKKLIDMGFDKGMDFTYFIGQHPELLNDFPELYYSIRVEKEIRISENGEIFLDNLPVDIKQLPILLNEKLNEDSRIVFSLSSHPKTKMSKIREIHEVLREAEVYTK